jgi:hypothetical protein
LASKLTARQSQSATGQNTSNNNIQDLTSRVSALESAQQPAVG